MTAAAEPHVHQWRRQMHMDGCHHYSTTYSCECGASAMTRDERDPTYDPYSLIWMDDEGGEPCARCDEIRAGAKVSHTVRIVAADGTIEKDETTLTEQGSQEEEAA